MDNRGFGNALVALSIVIQRRFVQICGDHDLTPAQGQLLCSVKDRPRRMAELAAAMGMAKNALSQLVDRTERRGLVQRESPGSDRRVITLYVTAEGKLIADALYADIAERLPDIAGDLSPDDQQVFRHLATAIAAARLSNCPAC